MILVCHQLKRGKTRMLWLPENKWTIDLIKMKAFFINFILLDCQVVNFQ